MYAEPYDLALLPEIHAAYEEHIYQTIAEKGYMTYDFFLPGLVIDAIENKRSRYLAEWAQELIDKKIQTVNMLGCHDGIPMLDLQGLLPEEDIQKLITLIVDRGGMVKNLHGQKHVYYQVMPLISVHLENQNETSVSTGNSAVYAGKTADLVSGSVCRKK